MGLRPVGLERDALLSVAQRLIEFAERVERARAVRVVHGVRRVEADCLCVHGGRLLKLAELERVVALRLDALGGALVGVRDGWRRGGCSRRRWHRGSFGRVLLEREAIVLVVLLEGDGIVVIVFEREAIVIVGGIMSGAAAKERDGQLVDVRRLHVELLHGLPKHFRTHGLE